MRRAHLVAAAGILVLAGVAPLGQGLWIYAKAGLAQVLLRDAWARTVAGESEAHPWPWADTWPVARLRAPRQDVDQIVLAGGIGRTMAFGPGHLDGSAAPGATGNCVLSGHRDTHFAFLERLEPDDRLLLEDERGRVRSYRVVASAVVEREETWVAGDTDDRVLTLVTCYPFRDPIPGGRMRYVVWAEGLDPPSAAGSETEASENRFSSRNPLANRQLSSNIQARGASEELRRAGTLYRISGGSCG